MLFFRSGQRYIYDILDWAHPDKAIFLVIGIVILELTVQVLLFWIYKLRVHIQRRFFGIELILTTKSMKFSRNNGYTNEAFKSTTNIVF